MAGKAGRRRLHVEGGGRTWDSAPPSYQNRKQTQERKWKRIYKCQAPPTSDAFPPTRLHFDEKNRQLETNVQYMSIWRDSLHADLPTLLKESFIINSKFYVLEI